MRMSHFICQTLWNTSFYVVFQTIISCGWQAAGSEWPYRSHPYNAGRARLGGGWGGCEQMCTLHAVVVLCVCLWTRISRGGLKGAARRFDKSIHFGVGHGFSLDLWRRYFAEPQSPTGPKKRIQGGDCCPRPSRMSLLRVPWLFPIRNPFELRGLCRRSYFGPRTCGRSINHF